VMSASATRDVLRHLQVPNFAALLFSLFHFRRSFLVVPLTLVMRKVQLEVTRKNRIETPEHKGDFKEW
jgi:hypothetical protein